MVRVSHNYAGDNKLPAQVTFSRFVFMRGGTNASVTDSAAARTNYRDAIFNLEVPTVYSFSGCLFTNNRGSYSTNLRARITNSSGQNTLYTN